MASPDIVNQLVEWSNSQNTANPLPLNKGLRLISDLYKNKNCDTLVPILPLLLSLKGRPFTLKDHMPMEPLYRFRDVPLNTLVKCGRQVSKSTSLAATSIMFNAITPYLNTLCVNPLFEQIRRFSNNSVRPFIEESPVRKLIQGETDVDNSVLQRTFSNGSNLFFTFAYIDAERARGIPADIIKFDEIQDIDQDFIPVIVSCSDASQYGLIQMSGTPKTLDNPIEMFWQKSSQAHWTVRCGCGHYNIATLECGLMDMLQDHGFACCKCSKLLNTREGFFYHMYADRKEMFPGYHIPQCVMPMHCENERRWYMLMDKKRNWKQYLFLNEVLGESCDSGQRLVTGAQLRRSANLPWNLNREEGLAARHSTDYTSVVMGVDWGGGGAGIVKKRKNKIIVENGTPSYTVMTVVGFRRNTIEPEVIYAERLNPSLTPTEEANYICKSFFEFKCSIFAHDYGGAGALRETIILQANLPEDVLMPCIYTRAPSQPIVQYVPPSLNRPRRYYSVDKARSLLLLCSVLNAGLIRFPKWPDVKDNAACLYEDFLALIETKTENPRGSDVYLVVKNPSWPDDFCHSLNLACLASWHSLQQYPDLAAKFGVSYGPETPDVPANDA